MDEAVQAAQPASPTKLSPREQADGDWPFWHELLGMMLTGGPRPARKKVEACEEAAVLGDAAALKLAAHALKGSAASLCLTRLTQVRHQLQG
jgi:hypothetical protein